MLIDFSYKQKKMCVFCFVFYFHKEIDFKVEFVPVKFSFSKKETKIFF